MEAGLRTNIRVGVQYLAAWLGGLGCVPLYNLMEDAATAEISRTQVWQWVHNPRGFLADGRRISLGLVRQVMEEELARIRSERRPVPPHLARAAELFYDLVADEELAEFLTLKAYEVLETPAEPEAELAPAPQEEPLRKVA